MPILQQTSAPVDIRVALIADIAASVNQVSLSMDSSNFQSLAIPVGNFASLSGFGNEMSTSEVMNAYASEGSQVLHEQRTELQRLIGSTQGAASYPFESLKVCPSTLRMLVRVNVLLNISAELDFCLHCLRMLSTAS